MDPIGVDGAFLSDIIKCYLGGEEFMIGGKRIRFSVEEEMLILGLLCHGYKISVRKNKGRLFERFGSKLDLQHKGLENLICELKSSTRKEDIEDTVRL